MRQFVVLGHDAPTTPDFSLNDLPGSAGRIDVLCRCINSAFFLSHDVRENVRLFLVHQDEVCIRLEGSDLRHLNPDERTTASLLRKALEAGQDLVGAMEVESTPGIYVSKKSFGEILGGIDESSTVVELHEEGVPINELGVPENPFFVLSDHNDFTRDEEELLAEYRDERVKLSPEVLHADHSIIVAHNYLDTRGFRHY
ncbi:MAG: tRNA (pseudouridine(54)-N(1))-methyltransferase TrmY [Halobacteria archaeon]|nr:tRNA (pseudouridine(54)-N(1))-methyltransferase TrmY [Halobacteria archaeon]